MTLGVPSAYHQGMSSVVKRSIALPTELFQTLELEAAQVGRTVSATLADAAYLWLSTRRGLRSLCAWERDNGALTAHELAEADRILDLAGVGSFKAAEGAASWERHLATAVGSPRFEETRKEIAIRPTLKELLLSADGRAAELAPPKTSLQRRKSKPLA
jgi:hypothetical protein